MYRYAWKYNSSLLDCFLGSNLYGEFLPCYKAHSRMRGLCIAHLGEAKAASSVAANIITDRNRML